jgi:transcriptional regulator with XRE-family HTH domain
MKPISDQNLDRPTDGLLGNGSGTPTITITSLEVRKVRKSLALTVDHFALLLGVSPSTIFRYENTGVNAFHQGPVARKLCLLATWIEEEGKVATLKSLLVSPGGLAILAGLLETGSVLTSNFPIENYLIGSKSPDSPNLDSDDKNYKLPSVESLAESILRAFHQTDSVMTEVKKEPDTYSDELASRFEAEARVMEAEARKLEAQARKLEALARIKSAENINNN